MLSIQVTFQNSSVFSIGYIQNYCCISKIFRWRALQQRIVIQQLFQCDHRNEWLYHFSQTGDVKNQIRPYRYGVPSDGKSVHRHSQVVCVQQKAAREEFLTLQERQRHLSLSRRKALAQTCLIGSRTHTWLKMGGHSAVVVRMVCNRTRSSATLRTIHQSIYFLQI